VYIKRTWKAGRTIEVKKTYSARYGKRISRGANIGETGKAQEEVNRRKAIAELRRILNENFKPGDWHTTFTYPTENPPGKMQAKKTLEKFLRWLRLLYKEQETELRYVHVTEYLHKRIHHHIILPDMPGRMELVKALWKKVIAEQFYTPEERERGEPLYLRFPWVQLDDSGQYGQLAEYLIKETDKTRKTPDAFSKRRYCCSKNIVHPKPTVEIIKAKEWRKDPPQRKGFYIDKRTSFNGVSEQNGLMMQETIYVSTVSAVKRRC
jgi:hypothetical protein